MSINVFAPFIFLLIIISAPSFSQGKFASDQFLLKISNNNTLNGTRYLNIQGTPYLDENFAQGNVSINYGNHACLLRYNIYENQMEFLQGTQIFALDPRSNIKRVEIGEKQFVAMEVNNKMFFLERLDSGRMSFYLKYTIDYNDAVEPSAMKYEGSPAKFSKVKNDFFYSMNDGPALKVEPFKKLIQMLPDKQKELTLFVKNEKLSANKIEDLKRFVEYYNLQ